MTIRRPSNTNVLAGLRCWRCGSTGPFRIQCEAFFEMHDDGATKFDELDWRDDSFMVCISCGDEGAVKHFKEIFPPPLDRVLRVACDDAVSLVADDRGLLRLAALQEALGGEPEPIDPRWLPGLPSTHVAFARQGALSANLTQNERIRGEFGNADSPLVYGPVVLCPKSFRPPTG